MSSMLLVLIVSARQGRLVEQEAMQGVGLGPEI